MLSNKYVVIVLVALLAVAVASRSPLAGVFGLNRKSMLSL